jgi:hypothetical protein
MKADAVHPLFRLPSAAAELQTAPVPKSMGDPVYDPDQIAVEVLVDRYTAVKVSRLAAQYRFSGKDPMTLCQKNAKVRFTPSLSLYLSARNRD